MSFLITTFLTWSLNFHASIVREHLCFMRAWSILLFFWAFLLIKVSWWYSSLWLFSIELWLKLTLLLCGFILYVYWRSILPWSFLFPLVIKFMEILERFIEWSRTHIVKIFFKVLLIKLFIDFWFESTAISFMWLFFFPFWLNLFFVLFALIDHQQWSF